MSSKIINLLVSFTLFALGMPAGANTFVGNGGNVGDVELLVTQKQIIETLQSIEEAKDSSGLCVCEKSFSNHKECESLLSLNDSQRLYCAQRLKETASNALQIMTSVAEFRWTHDSINVIDNDKIIAADAVADSKEKTITLNQSRFLNLTPTERVFLLSHELFHLVEIESQYLTDRGPIGPFTGTQGQREFLNSVAGGIVMESHKNKKFDKYSRLLNRPKSYLLNWVYIGVSASSFLDGSKSTYAHNNQVGGEIGYQRYFTRWGLFANYRHEQKDGNIRTSIESEESTNVLSLGASYRFFPFTDPLTSLGQSFVSVSMGAEYLRSHYKLSDPYVGVDSEEDSLSPIVGCKYYMPIGDLWFYGGLALDRKSVV